MITGLSLKQQLALLAGSALLCSLIWGFALWYTGATLEYRQDHQSGLIALRLAPGTGLSLQWSAQGHSIWVWRGTDNRRLWPAD